MPTPRKNTPRKNPPNARPGEKRKDDEKKAPHALDYCETVASSFLVSVTAERRKQTPASDDWDSRHFPLPPGEGAG